MSTAIALYKGTNSDLVLQAQSHGVTLNSVERRILAIDGQRKISDTPGHELLNEVRAILAGVFRDLGIAKQPDAFDASRFMDLLREYYSDFSSAEVKQAFELYAVGELDSHLPRDRSGAVLQHFQQFSAMFYTQILRAYRQRRNEAKRDVSGRVGLRLLEAADEERDPYADRATFYTVLRNVCTEIAAGGSPVYMVTLAAEAIFRKLKLIPAHLEPSPRDVHAARSHMTRGKDSAVEDGIRNMIDAGHMPDDLQHVAQGIALRRVLREELRRLGPQEVGRRFDWLIERLNAKRAEQ